MGFIEEKEQSLFYEAYKRVILQIVEKNNIIKYQIKSGEYEIYEKQADGLLKFSSYVYDLKLNSRTISPTRLFEKLIHDNPDVFCFSVIKKEDIKNVESNLIEVDFKNKKRIK